MANLDFEELRLKSVERLQNTPAFEKCLDWDHSKWLQALVGEVGELANVLKKIDRGDFAYVLKADEIEKELADIQIYLDLLAHTLCVDLSNATINKFNEVSDRVGSDVKLEGF